jgi:hypothetical protein
MRAMAFSTTGLVDLYNDDVEDADDAADTTNDGDVI